MLVVCVCLKAESILSAFLAILHLTFEKRSPGEFETQCWVITCTYYHTQFIWVLGI